MANPGIELTIVLSIVSAVASGAAMWGAFRTEFKHLKDRVDEAEKIGREFERQTAVLMAEAVKAMSTAVEHLAGWGDRYEERMSRTEHRSRSNRAAIRRLEQARGEEAKRKLARAGVPTEVLEEVSDAFVPRDGWEQTNPTLTPREDAKR